MLFQIAIYSSASAQTGAKAFTVSPSSVEQGKLYELTIRSVKCAPNDLLHADLAAPLGSGITVEVAVGINDCTMIARVRVARDAPTDTAVLRVTKQDSVLGLIDLSVTRALSPEPLPVPTQPSAPPVTTSSTRDLDDEAPRVEVFGGYSYARVDVTDFGHLNANGWNASVAGNFNKYVGVVADVSGHYKSDLGVHGSAYTFLAGPRAYARNEIATTFAHALFGVSRIGAEYNFILFKVRSSATAFAAAVGGGVDINAHRNVAVRAIQIDYLLTRFSDELGDRRTQNNLRVSTGIVFRFGR